MRPRRDVTVFTWDLAAKVADSAWEHFKRGRQAFHHVDVFCDENRSSENWGELYVSDDTDVWSQIMPGGGSEWVEHPGVLSHVMKLSGFHTRDQWKKQVHAKLGRLPLLTPVNGWSE